MASKCMDWREDYGVPIAWTQSSTTDFDATALQAGSVVIDGSLSRIFVAAYLLTGSARRAEQLMLGSIRQLDIQRVPGGRLSWKALGAAFLESGSEPEQTPDDTPWMPLPAELRRVLRLSTRRRHCFVLRFLMAMPRAYCAGLLRMDAAEVDALCALAARELTDMARQPVIS